MWSDLLQVRLQPHTPVQADRKLLPDGSRFKHKMSLVGWIPSRIFHRILPFRRLFWSNKGVTKEGRDTPVARSIISQRFRNICLHLKLLLRRNGWGGGGGGGAGEEEEGVDGDGG